MEAPLTSHSAAGAEAALIVQLQHLYDRHRYLDAFTLSERYWNTPPDLQQLSIDELLLAGRLAWRLGGLRRSRWLLREAARRDPGDARVRLFTSHLRFPRRHLLDDLRSFEERPDLDAGDAEMRASWYASAAAIWAAGAATACSSSAAAPMTRSSCAASASSPARSRLPSPTSTPACDTLDPML